MELENCENSFLKRKTTDNLDENFHKPKKSHIENILNNSNKTCNEIYTFNNNLYNVDSETDELLDLAQQLIPLNSTILSATYCCNQYDNNNWNNTDLLELDERYNASATITITEEDVEQTKTRVISTDIESDVEDKNLSWLYNFKLDELPDLSPGIHNSVSKNWKTNDEIKSNKNINDKLRETTNEKIQNQIGTEETTAQDDTLYMPKKPPFTYTELIEYALEEKGELTVSGIYHWISDKFPYYKSNDDRWKNSVRHNLSINPHFRKGAKASQGAGHLWKISSRDSEENVLAWEHKKQRFELFFKLESLRQEKMVTKTTNITQVYDEDATAVATLTQQMQIENLSPQSVDPCYSPLYNNTNVFNNDQNFKSSEQDELRRTAGEILNGVQRNVEVQRINCISPSKYCVETISDGDYLNPISKEDVVCESGLRLVNYRSETDESFYADDIDPIELGVTMSNVEEEVLFSDEFNLNYFGITSSSDLVA